MDHTLNFLNIAVLFGGVQGLSLCFFLYQRRNIHNKAYLNFALFLASLSLFNLEYTLLYMDIYHIGSFPLGALPIPYKYLIGLGFYLYVRSYISPPRKAGFIRPIYLFIPAICYGALRLYWSFLILSGKNTNIIREVYDIGFFTANEFFYLSLNLGFIFLALKLLRDQREDASISFGTGKHWRWLKRFGMAFLAYTLTHFLIQITNFFFNTYDLRLFYYPILISNSVFIYWIGFIGYTKPNLLLHRPLLRKEDSGQESYNHIEEKLKEAVEEQEAYRNPGLTVIELAKQLEVPSKEISRYINDQLKMNFSQYLNYHRTQKVIELLQSDLAHKYTIVGLAKEAGFSSKSSFNKVFKDQTGCTPSEYRKKLEG